MTLPQSFLWAESDEEEMLVCFQVTTTEIFAGICLICMFSVGR